MLDVKTGSGAFMKTLDDSEKLAQAMVDIGTQVGRRTAALISDMDQPLGFAIGNALEVREAIETLHGRGPADLTALCIALASHMVVLGGQAGDLEEAEALLREKLRSGEALAKFKQFVAAQGADPAVGDDPSLLPQAPLLVEVPAPKGGCVHAIQAEELGLAAMLLGAGRETKDSVIDHAVGITLQRKVGENVREGETLALLHVREDNAAVQTVLKRVQEAYAIGEEQLMPSPLLLSIVTEQGVTRF